MSNKAVLAYSGGLDTSYCLVNLTKDQGMEVHTVIVNTGGFSAEELKDIEARAYELGSSKHVTIDITDKYGRLLQNQYEFILHFQDQIQAQAQQLYDLANKNRNSFIARLSCDFKLLETALNQ